MKKPLRVAVAGGKGGAGKTTVALGLALSSPGRVQLLDCDVEGANDHLFLGYDGAVVAPFSLPVPRVDADRCVACGACVEFCSFGALALAGGRVLVFDELCHACGGCTIVCPHNAIHEQANEIGTIVSFPASPLRHVYGELAIGRTVAPPLIRAVKRSEADRLDLVVVDSPPGASCPMVTAVEGADFGILVTENTPFGLHDLEVVVEVLQQTKTPMGVVVNRCDVGSSDVEAFCRRNAIPILLRIPHDEEIAKGYARGRTILQSRPAYRRQFAEVIKTIRSLVSDRRST